MMTRRVLLATGAVVAGGAALLGAAQITHRLDDSARAVGLDPKPQPDPRDTQILQATATSQSDLTATVEAIDRVFPELELAAVIAVCQEQLAAVGGSATRPAVPSIPETREAAVKLLATSFDAAGRDRAEAAVEAVSPELTRVLASMSAGLVQLAEQVSPA